jgi:2-polyprenyl-6-methoxyphenol hydroxylase-like FAD-dependent oxidoreductase
MNFDLIVVGGGLAGSTLAARMAGSGRRVLVLESEKKFRDRVRGENMLPWGVAAARRLGVYESLVSAGGHEPVWWNTYAMGQRMQHRSLPETTPGGDKTLNIYHPDLQEVLLQCAAESGAEVRRGTRVTGLELASGQSPRVVFEENGAAASESARLVVGADGRFSNVRTWGGFELERNPEFLTIAGVLVEGSAIPEDGIHLAMGPGFAMFAAPLGAGRARTYFVYPSVAGRRNLTGDGKTATFLEGCRATGVPEDWLAHATPVGPLAEFDGADRWTTTATKDGVALIGDAAAATDPSWGCGLSLTLLDVEHLSKQLLATDDWKTALDRYDREHLEYSWALRRTLGWMTELFWTPGPEADDRRQRVFARMAQDPREFPDNVGLGPFGPSDERARRLTLGLET